MIQALSQMTGRPQPDLQEEIISLDAPVFEFAGQLLIDPSVADSIVDRWAESIKGQLRSFPSTPSPTNGASADSNGAKPKTAAKKPAAKPAAKKSTATRKPSNKASA